MHVDEVLPGGVQQEQIHSLTIFLKLIGGAWWLLIFFSRDAKQPIGKAISESEESAVYYEAVTFTVCPSKHIA